MRSLLSDKYCEKCVFCSFFNLCHTKFSNKKIGFLSTLISEANIFVRFSNEEEISIFYSCKMTYFYIRMFSSQNPALYIILSFDVGMKNVEKKIQENLSFLKYNSMTYVWSEKIHLNRTLTVCFHCRHIWIKRIETKNSEWLTEVSLIRVYIGKSISYSSKHCRWYVLMRLPSILQNIPF